MFIYTFSSLLQLHSYKQQTVLTDKRVVVVVVVVVVIVVVVTVAVV